MKSLNNILKGVRAALLTVTDECYHYRRPPRPKKSYIVWAEDGEEDSFEAEDRKGEQQLHGTIDYYAFFEFDEKVDMIQEALNDAGIGFRLNSVQYEDETNLIHFEWDFWAA